MQYLDPFQRPPESIRSVFKKYQKIKSTDLALDGDILHLTDEPYASLPNKVHVVRQFKAEQVANAFRTFAVHNGNYLLNHVEPTSPITAYEHDDIPGLHIIPSLVPHEFQLLLLSRLLHRDLSNPSHLTNIHAHYHLSYPPFPKSSFFSLSPFSQDIIAHPIDPTIHKPLRGKQLLSKKLRWMTLGGQYDWTAKRYPDEQPPEFPEDIRVLLEAIFTDTKAQAAIVNLYSPGDTLSVHRDVAESCPHGLVSLSLGCDSIFIIGTEDKVITLRLRSGSALYMSGPSRFAWHGVPQVIAGTCPDDLQDWPAGSGDQDDAFQDWKGWMADKRVNLNVRQVRT